MILLDNEVLPSMEQMEFVIESMRNPLNSWSRSDSFRSCNMDYSCEECKEDGTECDGLAMFVLGDNDRDLMKRLSKAGTDHRKYLRQMPIMVRITAPLYWVAEHDTYKVATVRNSCSFMHKGVSKPFELNDFSYNEENHQEIIDVVCKLNKLRDLYLATKDDNYFFAIRQLLPSGYNVTYNWTANYEVLANIYRSRKNHRLNEWKVFCKWIEELPYSELITNNCSEQ